MAEHLSSEQKPDGFESHLEYKFAGDSLSGGLIYIFIHGYFCCNSTNVQVVLVCYSRQLI